MMTAMYQLANQYQKIQQNFQNLLYSNRFRRCWFLHFQLPLYVLQIKFLFNNAPMDMCAKQIKFSMNLRFLLYFQHCKRFPLFAEIPPIEE